MSYLQKDKTLEKENNFISQDLDWERGLLYADTHVAVDMDVEADVAEIKTGTEAECIGYFASVPIILRKYKIRTFVLYIFYFMWYDNNDLLMRFAELC